MKQAFWPAALLLGLPLFATAARGTEELLAEELAELGAVRVRADRGGVRFLARMEGAGGRQDGDDGRLSGCVVCGLHLEPHVRGLGRV